MGYMYLYMYMCKLSDRYSICRIGIKLIEPHKIIAEVYVQCINVCFCSSISPPILHSELNLKNAKELFNCVMPMADIVIPQVKIYYPVHVECTVYQAELFLQFTV